MSTRCTMCKKHTHLVFFRCSICESIHCIKCRLPEDHKCAGLDKLKDKSLLAEKLNKESIKDNHNNHDKI